MRPGRPGPPVLLRCYAGGPAACCNRSTPARMTPTPSRHPLGWLGQQPSFRELTDRAERLLALQGDLQLCLPAQQVTVLALEDDTLVVAAAGSAAAAKLRQMAPSVLAGMRARGWSLARIRFRPRPPGSAPPRPAPRIKAPIPETALAGLQAPSQQVANPALQQALEQLLRTQERQRRLR